MYTNEMFCVQDSQRIRIIFPQEQKYLSFLRRTNRAWDPPTLRSSKKQIDRRVNLTST